MKLKRVVYSLLASVMLAGLIPCNTYATELPQENPEAVVTNETDVPVDTTADAPADTPIDAPADAPDDTLDAQPGDVVEEPTAETETPSAVTVPEAIKADGYFALETPPTYIESGLNVEINVSDEISRIEVIYIGVRPDVVFYDTNGTMYEGSNNTYPDGMSILCRENTELLKQDNATYGLTTYYIEYPSASGAWVMSVRNMANISDIVIKETITPNGWQYMQKEGTAEISGGVWYYTNNNSHLNTLLTPTIVVGEDKEDPEAIDPEEEVDYSGYVAIAGFVLFVIIVIVGFVLWNKKIKAEQYEKKIADDLKESKKRSKERSVEEIEQELKEQFNDDDWKDASVQWDTAPKTIQNIDEEPLADARNDRIEKMREINRQFAESSMSYESSPVERKTKPSKPKVEQPKPAELKKPEPRPVPNIPNIPDAGTFGGSDDTDDFF